MYAKTETGSLVIHDRREMLRVKLKSLAAEAKIIRYEERKAKGQLRDELHLHRVNDVRSWARCTHIAYGLIRGMKYEQIEPRVVNPLSEREWDKIEMMVKRYGNNGVYSQLFVAPEPSQPESKKSRVERLFSLFRRKAA